jgi:septal ring factor EnvC (AmiA/AmiB activator)
MLILVLASAFDSHAQQGPRDDLQKQQQQLLKELAELTNNLESIRKNKKEALGAYAVIKKKIATREALINNINREIRQYDDKIYLSEVEINHLKKELDTLKQNYAKSIVFAYKNRGSYEYLNFLFSADNFNDAVKRITYLKSYRGYREKEADNILKTQNLLVEKINEFNSSKIERSNVLQVQSSQLKVLEVDKHEKDEAVKQLKDQEKDISAQIRKREKERIALNRAIETAIRRAREEAEKQAKIARQKAIEEEKRRQTQLAREAKEREAAARAAAAAANNKPAPPPSKPAAEQPSVAVVEPKKPTAPKNARPYSDLEGTAEGLTLSINFEKNKGSLPWPLSGNAIITGHFGKEKYGDTKLIVQNDGIIISTDIGTNIKSVADGTVTSIFDMGEAYAVAVQHGKYFTIYNKLATTNVSVGEAVKAGTLLGKVAANLDGQGEFEFRVTSEKGTPLNPESWLKRSR